MIVECFVIGPIGDRFAPLGSEARDRYEQAIDVYENLVQAACANVGVAPVRADEIADPGEVTESICLRLRDSQIVVADVSNANPNVMYELGLRHATCKPTVQIGEEGRLPFDISSIRTIRFVRSPAGIVDGRKRLEDALRAALAGKGALVTASRIFGSRQALEEATAPPPEPEVEEPGLVDLMVEMEASFPAINGILAEMSVDLERLGTLTAAATSRIESAAAQGSPKAIQIEAARLADELAPVADRFEMGAGQYEDHLGRIDDAVQVLIVAIKTERLQPGEFPRQIADMARVARESMASATGLADSIGKNEYFSRTLRVPFRRIRLALGRVANASESIQQWERDLNGGALGR